MSGHGRVIAATKVLDHGDNRARWNLTILGDGYREDELGRFHQHVDDFIGVLQRTAPFGAMWEAINIHRIDVASEQSGADDPMICPDPADARPGSGASPATFFDAAFCSLGPGHVRLSRLLTVDAAMAQATASRHVLETHQVLVIVNTETYGGSGGQIAVCSAHPSATQIALHEIGHSFAKLADEYEGDGAGAPVGEPQAENLTRATTRAQIKWRAFIAPATPVPSACNAGCAQCQPPAAPPPAGAIGLYEGGGYAKCGLYRPSAACKMRTIEADFCAVCADVIRRRLTPYRAANGV